MVRKTWKSVERRVAKKFGTTRTPLSGGNSGHTRSDTLHKSMYVEVKYRKKFSHHSLFYDTATKAKKEKKVPLCITVEPRKKPLITCLLSDIPAIAAALAAGETISEEEVEE